MPPLRVCFSQGLLNCWQRWLTQSTVIVVYAITVMPLPLVARQPLLRHIYLLISKAFTTFSLTLFARCYATQVTWLSHYNICLAIAYGAMADGCLRHARTSSLRLVYERRAIASDDDTMAALAVTLVAWWRIRFTIIIDILKRLIDGCCRDMVTLSWRCRHTCLLRHWICLFHHHHYHRTVIACHRIAANWLPPPSLIMLPHAPPIHACSSSSSRHHVFISSSSSSCCLPYWLRHMLGQAASSYCIKQYTSLRFNTSYFAGFH